MSDVDRLQTVSSLGSEAGVLCRRASTEWKKPPKSMAFTGNPSRSNQRDEATNAITGRVQASCHGGRWDFAGTSVGRPGSGPRRNETSQKTAPCIPRRLAKVQRLDGGNVHSRKKGLGRDRQGRQMPATGNGQNGTGRQGLNDQGHRNSDQRNEKE